ncbi:MAG TPA: hypothetical protein VGI39_14010 [Polyangiaceae bacterium]|jgi:DNA-directed RNA polymerase specialized sigma24 family protein
MGFWTGVHDKRDEGREEGQAGRGALDVWDEGDDAALTTLCATLRPLLLEFFESKLADTAGAEDLVEETLRRVQFGAYTRRPDAVAWVMDIAQRLADAAVHHSQPRLPTSSPDGSMS